MDELFRIQYEQYLVESKKSFQAAITRYVRASSDLRSVIMRLAVSHLLPTHPRRQSKINKDSLYLLETLEHGRSIEPYFVVDCHAPSVQGLYYR